jgi:predicted GIY-YIG superfamily endonuclease
MLHFVYELYDPRTNTPGYVGITNNPNQRYWEHLEGRVRKGKKYEWVKSLLDEGVKPKLRILETLDERSEAMRRERYWVQYYTKQGIVLTNAHLVYSKRERESSDKIIHIQDAMALLSIKKSMLTNWIKKGYLQRDKRGYVTRASVEKIQGMMEEWSNQMKEEEKN